MLWHSAKWTANEVSQRAAETGRARLDTDVMSRRALWAMRVSLTGSPAATGFGLKRGHAHLIPGVIHAEAETLYAV